MNLPPDNAARELALDITQSHHVEAPAGSGKTMLLVARLIKLLSCVRHPHEILSLTFTNTSSGPGTQDQLDASWGELALLAEISGASRPLAYRAPAGRFSVMLTPLTSASPGLLTWIS